MTDIMMLSCNRSRLTELSIREIAARTTTPCRLVVLDNGSTDDTPQMLQRLYLEGIVHKLLLHPENCGVHWGHNRLLDEVESDLYVCADNDLIPQSPVDGVDWLALLLRLITLYPDYSAIACRPHVMIGDNVDKMFAPGVPEIVQRAHIGAHLRLMRADAVRDVGGWQKQVRPSRNHEEKWICGRLRKAGWKVGYSRDIHCIHQFGDSDLGEDPWGYTEGTYHEGHREIWPPVNHWNWERMRIDWETCRKSS